MVGRGSAVKRRAMNKQPDITDRRTHERGLTRPVPRCTRSTQRTAHGGNAVALHAHARAWQWQYVAVAGTGEIPNPQHPPPTRKKQKTFALGNKFNKDRRPGPGAMLVSGIWHWCDFRGEVVIPTFTSLYNVQGVLGHRRMRLR